MNWIRGAMVARLTPDQKVACSIHVGFTFLFFPLIIYSLTPTLAPSPGPNSRNFVVQLLRLDPKQNQAQIAATTSSKRFSTKKKKEKKKLFTTTHKLLTSHPPLFWKAQNHSHNVKISISNQSLIDLLFVIFKNKY